MTRTPHDQFAKQYLEELLTLLGKVETSRDVASEVREIDVYFIPVIPPPNDPKILGLLGQMATTASVYEPFRNQPQRLEIQTAKQNSTLLLISKNANLEGKILLILKLSGPYCGFYVPPVLPN